MNTHRVKVYKSMKTHYFFCHETTITAKFRGIMVFTIISLLY